MKPGMKPTRIVLAVAVPVVLLAAGCGGSDRSNVEDIAKANGMTDAQFLACEDLVNESRGISPEDADARGEVARTVNEWAQQAGPELQDAGDMLARTAATNADAWQVAVDTFAGRCIELGWPTQEQLDAE